MISENKLCKMGRVIDTCGMWGCHAWCVCAAFQEHIWPRVDIIRSHPPSLKWKLGKIESRDIWSRCDTNTWHFQIHAMASDPKEDHHSKLFVVEILGVICKHICHEIKERTVIWYSPEKHFETKNQIEDGIYISWDDKPRESRSVICTRLSPLKYTNCDETYQIGLFISFCSFNDEYKWEILIWNACFGDE